MAKIHRQHRQTATYMWNKCTIVYHTLWAQKESCPHFCYQLLWKAPHCSKSICKISASFKIKRYPGNSYCNRSNPRTTSTSTVNNNNNNNAVNKVFKFYTVSHIHIKKGNTITWTKSCMKPSGKEFLKPITIWSFLLKNIFL